MIPTYEAVFDEDSKGVFGISLVENPATQEYFVALSEDEKKKLKEKQIQLATIDEEQRILLGLVLEPDTPIYRNEDGEEFNITFNSQTVKSLAHAFISNGYQHNSTIEHNEDDKIKGIAFVESWTVDNSKKDKSNAYGLEYPKGSWVIAMKVNDDATWNDYIKTGKVKGFSIDAVVKLKKVSTNKSDIKMSLTEKLQKAMGDLKVKLGMEKEQIIKLGQINLEDGSVTFEFEGETMEVGKSVFAVDPSDAENKIPVPVNETPYPLEGGGQLVVSEEGIIGEGSSMEKVEEEAAKEVAADPAKEEENLNDDAGNKIKSILIKYQEEADLKMSEMQTNLDAKIGEMQKQILELQEQLSTVNKEVVEMSEQPVKKPKKAMATIELNKNGRLLEKLRNANN